MNNNWRTPSGELDLVREVYGGAIDIDPCAHPNDTVGASIRFFGPEHGGLDGLSVPWGTGQTVRRAFVNPPYSRDQLGKWVAKCRDEEANLVETISLLPVDTSTAWFHESVFQSGAAALCWRRGRIRFIEGEGPGAQGGSPKFASVYVFWGTVYVERFLDVFARIGSVQRLRERAPVPDVEEWDLGAVA